MKTRTAVLRLFLGILTVLFLLPASGVVPHGQDGNSRPPVIVTPSSPRIDVDFGKIPLQFIPNRGQMDGSVAYYVQGRDKTIYFTAEGLTFVLARWAGENDKENPGALQASELRTESRWVVKLDFVNSDKNVKPVGLEKSGTAMSYFKGRPEEWKAGLAACSKIAYRDLWPGIDLVYSGTFNRMKYEFVVNPGADPSRIRLAYRGAERVALTAEGRLEVRTPAGGFEDDTPVAYQEVDGERLDIPVAFDLVSEAYGFDVGDYDRSRTLILDPSSLVYCGFIGGEAMEEALGIAVDAEGNAYILGRTTSVESTFPVAVGPDLTYNGGNNDTFVAKVNSSGTALVYCGYIGGSGTDNGSGIAVDSLGNAYITGSTDSPESSFPVLAGPGLAKKSFSDAFVAKVNSSGTALVYCGYIGGSGSDGGSGIAVDGLGSAYIVGSSSSSESFPVAVGPSLIHNGSIDVFVAKVDPSGTALSYCGFIGGAGQDSGVDIAVDSMNNAYVVGQTTPLLDDSGNPVPPFLPVVVGPDLTYNGSYDTFVAKIDASGAALAYCGYIGGNGEDWISGIAVDLQGNAYVAGSTSSRETSFPVTVGPDLTYNGTPSYSDAFVAKIDASGLALVYCGYIGGTKMDSAAGIAVDADGNAYLVGTTDSSVETFPETVGPGLVHKGDPNGSDVFVAKVAPSGANLVYCGFISGHRGEDGRAIALDATGHAYVAGNTSSTDGYWGFFPTIVGPDTTFNGWGYEAFVAKVQAVPAVSDPGLDSIQPSVAPAGDQGFTLIVEGSDFVQGAYVRWDGSYRPTTYVDDTELHAEIGESDLRAGMEAEVSVCNPDGETTGSLPFTINNPVPSLDALIPTCVTSGAGNSSLRVLGTNFVPNSIVRWNGNAGESSYLNGTIMDASVPSAEFNAGGEFQVTIENPAPRGGTSNALVFRVSTFTLTPTPTSATVDAGQSATYTILLTPQFASFDAPVTFNCLGLPRACSGSFFPSNTTPGTNMLNTILTLTTRAPEGSASEAMLGSTSLFPPALTALLISGAFFFRPRPRRPVRDRMPRRMFAAGTLAILIIVLAGCGAGGDEPEPPDIGTPSGTYQMTVTGTAGSLTVSTMITLVVH